MKKNFNKTAFIFRRDLRLEDNLGLLKLLEKSETVLPIFIFDPKQVDRKQNEYFSEPAFHFLLNSLKELNEKLLDLGSQLFIFHGDPVDVINSLIEKDEIEGVFVNKDYTPFSRKRDKEISDICSTKGVKFERHDDLCLSPIENIKTEKEKLYTVFTPFMKRASTHEVPKPIKNSFNNYYKGNLNTETVKLDSYSAEISNMKLILSGGRNEALEIISNPIFLQDYKENRNHPGKNVSTSKLSAHHKFGTISIRESYHMAFNNSGKDSHYISELYWRDFYYYTAYHFPLVFKKSFLPWAKFIKWINDKDQFKSWCEGKTGVPMVDAGMRELNNTGWMHNRSRMIVASYLTKNLLIDWRWGERYFASKLIDYDPSQNNGGWQWSASVGTDPRPLRIFNPYIQVANYDSEAVYIKKWVPELLDVNSEILSDGKTQDFSTLGKNYPSPIQDQKDSYHRSMDIYRSAKESWKNQNIS